MSIKSTLLVTAILAASTLGFSQFTFGIQVAPGKTLASIKDDMPDPSKKDLASDGQTSIIKQLGGKSFRLIADYELNETFSLSSGLWFGARKMNVRNDDGSYIGTSVYQANYIHIPVLLRYRTEELTENLRIIGKIGPTIDFRTREKAIGSDYAHFMNFADNRHDLDPGRGRNGDNVPTKLFNGIGVSLYLSLGAEYKLSDNFSLNAGFGYHQGLTNILNSKLKFNDTEKTPIRDTAVWRTSLLSFNLGVSYTL